MDIKKEVTKVVYKAVDEINQLLPQDKKVKKSLETVLLGKSAALDSLGLVNLIVEIEQGIQENFNSSINLADQRSFAGQKTPLQNINALIEYLSYYIINEKGV